MDYNDCRTYFLTFENASETTPFGPNAYVYKIHGKMFGLLSNRLQYDFINVKCEPTLALELRRLYDSVQPGYHMNKKHWNMIILDDSIPAKYIQEWIEASYQLILSKIRK